LLGSLETVHKEAARVRCLEEVNATIESRVKEISVSRSRWTITAAG
jgi:hypothetical protein